MWPFLILSAKGTYLIITLIFVWVQTVDQFFNSSLPLDIVHLRSLLIGITSSLQVYLMHMENQQGKCQVLDKHTCIILDHCF